ncbi:MAG TPA: NUDIX domain-containing protein [Solirubrobacteraceae bacterium]|nr:NUDIX domain-containing protein [Solirubrobacteraceae bacterium]
MSVHEVRAAGGVVVRDGLVAVVHRPKYDDWSLPKGKLDPGETWEQGALREVEEETGLGCTLAEPLESAHYTDHQGRPKEVRYWHMEVVADTGFEVSGEVDELRWVALAEADALLTYSHDRSLVRIATVSGPAAGKDRPMADEEDRTSTASPEAPGGYAPPAAGSQQKTSGKAIASLVCGVVGLLIAGIILGIIAVILGVVAKREIDADPQLSGDGLAIAGIAVGAIAFVLAVVILITIGPTVFG